MTEREQMEQAIRALEAQRAMLGDAVVDTALAPLREKLAALEAQAEARERQQRKQVTVLFADVSGFTAMSEKVDAEEMSATMNALWSRLDKAIVDHGGMIDKHIGDAVMALFGAPTAREDDPERAIRAALAMQRELAEFRAHLDSMLVARPGAGVSLPEIAMRIGINTGPVLLGQVGTTSEYTAMGDAVNVANRLEHAAPVSGILISHDTYRHVRGVFDVLSLEPISVKGKSEPIQVYVVRGAKPRAFRVPTRGVEGIETRTIGREAELQLLRSAMETARHSRRTHLVSVVAEAGVGKSRLLYEFNNWLELLPERILLFKGRASQEMINLPYSLIRDVLAFRFEIQDSDRASTARDKIERGIAEFLGPVAVEKAHFIGHLVGIDFSHSPYLQGILGDARQIRDRAFHYIGQLFEAVTREHAAAILLEDIHWADDGSLNLIEYLARERPDLPLLIIGLARPTLFERQSAWDAELPSHIRLDVRPLTEPDCRRLVAEILRKVPMVPAELDDLIVSRAEGSPYYVEELIKMLIDDGVIVAREDQWRVELERLAAVRVPATLTGVLQSRLDSLPPPEREVLQQASVVGRVFWEEVVARLHHPDTPRIELPATASERLAALSRKELVFHHDPSAFAGMHEYIFKHALLHDVTYESVLMRLRRAYHAQVAAGLIELSGERVGEFAGRIGEHFERAGEWLQAAEWYGRAGKQARDTYAPEAAISYYRKALEFAKEFPATASRFDLYAGLGEALVDQARYAEAMDTFTAMREAADAAGDRLAEARAWYGLATAQVNHGDHHAAVVSAERAEALAQAADARLELAKALEIKGGGLYRLGDAEAARAAVEQALVIATELDARRPMASSLNLLGLVHNMLGRYELAERHFEKAIAICRELEDRRRVMSLVNNLGVIAEARGDYAAALERYRDALQIARDIGHRDGEFVFLNNVGAARVGLGEYVSAEADLRHVIQMAGRAGPGMLSNAHGFLAEACLGQGKVAEALEAARLALGLALESDEQEGIGAAWRTLGQVVAQWPEPVAIGAGPDPSRRVDAVACFAESLRVCTETGMEGERARTLKAWATHELQRGDRARGAEMWQEAHATFARLGADREAERMSRMP